MAISKRKCPNGHQYDASIYGDNCPFCPNPTQMNTNASTDGKTQINAGGGHTHTSETSGPTVPFNGNAAPVGGGHTVIRPVGGGGTETPQGRKVVGVLVSYTANPCGEVYKLYEGRNTIGRDVTNDIAITSDTSVSSLHLVIVYREADGRFLMEDQLTSNGTWLNGEFASDRVALKTNDVIVIGGTKLVFLAIPAGL